VQACVVYRLRPGAEAEYDRLHEAVPPEVLAELRESGFHDYSIFRTGTTVIAVYRAPTEALERGTNASTSEAQRRWSDLVTPLREPFADGTTEGRARLVFRLE